MPTIEQAQERKQEHFHEPKREAPREHNSLLLALGLVVAAAAFVLVVLPLPQSRICGESTGCPPEEARPEVMAVVVRKARPVAVVFRSIRPADSDGAAPSIPPSETWPSQ